MFIQTEAMPDATRMKFYPGEAVLSSGVAEFGDEEAAREISACRPFIQY